MIPATRSFCLAVLLRTLSLCRGVVGGSADQQLADGSFGNGSGPSVLVYTVILRDLTSLFSFLHP